MASLIRIWSEVCLSFEKISKIILSLVVSAYRTIGTTHLGGACRFQPSCSEYALHAIENHPAHKAFWLICKRVIKCRPGGPLGYDPVPLGEGSKNATK